MKDAARKRSSTISITSSKHPLAVGRRGRSRGKSGALPADDGTTDFSVLQNELKGRSTKIVMVAFDLLYLNGRDLRSVTLFERKTLLRKIISGTAIQFSESFEIDGQDMFKHACKTGWKAWSLFALVSRP
ncbi:hypothetical protein ABH994_006515 [Bradyrhizobium yuanmingense]|uniref:ATP-dependent DNA ligase family profile domain-containing protein n=1 Tax=Bradyrhizobium yuanmingense TaxID=108015 RepID=A0ABV4GMG9_9BRAD